ncbi:nuclease-related domain-containing protein [Fictibacillus sp. NRS-1165]|uniref:nuclease-related domain-containing protein n=1 Tax=Fictibacillus sp. NRS-1165 TaxID=3144463 RepID=UPI003D1F81DF
MDILYKFMDNKILLLTTIVVLIVIVLGVLLILKKKNKNYDQMFEEFQMEAVENLSKVEKDLKQEKEQLVNQVKEGYESKISDFKEYVRTVEKISRTTSEVNTHNILTEIKEKLVLEGTIQPFQMMILDNVFFPFKKANGEIGTTKIDHIVLMKTGIYIIDTNEFHGDILYGISKENTKQFSFILDNLFPSEDDETEKTIVFVNKNKDPKELNVISFDDPSKQVMSGVDNLNQLLEKHIQYNSITPILYFHANKLINYSQNKIPYVFDDKQTLYKFFMRQLDGYNDVHSEDELEKMKNIIENVSIN